jgi:hypothetical protein
VFVSRHQAQVRRHLQSNNNNVQGPVEKVKEFEVSAPSLTIIKVSSRSLQVLSMEGNPGWSFDSLEPVILGQDYKVHLEGSGFVTFPMDTSLPAVAAVGPDNKILFLGADFQHCIVDGPKVIMHKQSVMSSEPTPFLVTREGALPLMGVSYPCQVRMESGHQYMIISPDNIVPLRTVLGTQDTTSTQQNAKEADINQHAASGSLVDSGQQLLLEPHTVVTEPPRTDFETTDYSPSTASGSDEPPSPPVSATVMPDVPFTLDQTVPGIFKKPVQNKHITLSSVVPAAPWIEEFAANYNEMFLSKLSPHFQKTLLNNETFTFARDNLAVLDELLILTVKLSGNHRPTLKVCEFLAQLLAKKHPLEYGSVDVERDEGGHEDTLASERNRGGVKGNANLGKRLHGRYYEVFVRRRNDKNRAESTEGEPEKKNTRGRPKAIHGIDPHKLSPKLMPAERIKKTKMLEDAESLDLEARCKIYKFEEAGSLVQHQMYAQSMSAAKASAPSFFCTTDHLQQLFLSISYQSDIYEQARKFLKSEMSIMEEYLLDELPAGEKTRLIKSIHESKEKPNEHVFCLLKLLAAVWKQDLDRVVFVTEKEEDCLKDCPEPHLVIAMGDVTQISLFVDHTKIFTCMDWPTAIASLIAVHYLANLHYGEECMLLKTYLQQEVCRLGKDIAQKRKRGLQQLDVLQRKKRDIAKRKYKADVSERNLI